MANVDQLAILMQGVEVWNRWYANNRHVFRDFNEHDFRGVDLS